ncbi:MAG: MaoC family dehydratase [Alphaproteobacteria bacterium]|nr:MaoC family dehydratase [Alphaproteobacteria bacterium]
MPGADNPVTRDRLHFEDLEVGQSFALPRRQVTRKMILDFAHRYDPLPFHTNEKAAKKSLLGGLAASGWQTAALSLRMLVDVFLSKAASMGGLGFTDLRWHRPVFVDDTISGTVTIVHLRASEGRPDWGIATLEFDIRNQNRQQVLSMRLDNLIQRRDARVGTDRAPPATEAVS